MKRLCSARRNTTLKIHRVAKSLHDVSLGFDAAASIPTACTFRGFSYSRVPCEPCRRNVVQRYQMVRYCRKIVVDRQESRRICTLSSSKARLLIIVILQVQAGAYQRQTFGVGGRANNFIRNIGSHIMRQQSLAPNMCGCQTLAEQVPCLSVALIRTWKDRVLYPNCKHLVSMASNTAVTSPAPPGQVLHAAL